MSSSATGVKHKHGVRCKVAVEAVVVDMKGGNAQYTSLLTLLDSRDVMLCVGRMLEEDGVITDCSIR